MKPLQSLRLCNAAGSAVTPSDPFIMAILSRQKNTNFGVAVLNKMGDKGEQYTEDSSVVSSLLLLLYFEPSYCIALYFEDKKYGRI